jgi:hypothetical protein
MTTHRVCNSIEILARHNLIFQCGSIFCFMLPIVWYLNMLFNTYNDILTCSNLRAVLYTYFNTAFSTQSHRYYYHMDSIAKSSPPYYSTYFAKFTVKSHIFCAFFPCWSCAQWSAPLMFISWLRRCM